MNTYKICLESARPSEIGIDCFTILKGLIEGRSPWSQLLQEQFPEDTLEICTDPYEADYYISVLSERILTENYISTLLGCWNFHPGVLPDYKGCGAFSWAIINEEKETGITLHKIDKGIDTGPIIKTWLYPIKEYDTAYSLFQKGMTVIRENFQEWVVRLLTADYTTRANSGGRTYTRKDLEKARNLTKYLRAFHFPGKPNAFIQKEKQDKKEIPYIESRLS